MHTTATIRCACYYHKIKLVKFVLIGYLIYTLMLFAYILYIIADVEHMCKDICETKCKP